MEKTANKAKGNFKVSGGVIVSIAQTATAETEGVALASSDKPAVVMNAPLFSKLVSPIKVRLTPESAAIEVSIITEMGYKAAEVAKAMLTKGMDPQIVAECTKLSFEQVEELKKGL